jgi:hypothetical protein
MLQIRNLLSIFRNHIFGTWGLGPKVGNLERPVGHVLVLGVSLFFCCHLVWSQRSVAYELSAITCRKERVQRLEVPSAALRA